MSPLGDIRARIEEVRRFLTVSMSIANAHTVEFYTHDVWDRLVDVPPGDVLSAISSQDGHQGAPERHANETPTTIFGFCQGTQRLVDVHAMLAAAKALSIPGLGVSMSREQLLQSLRLEKPHVSPPHAERDASESEAGEFMNLKKSHEVRYMSEVVSCLAQGCGVKQVIDVGSGKGYLCSHLSLKYGLRVYGIDSSSSNTHGAHERNRKLKRFSRAYRAHPRKNGDVPVDPFLSMLPVGAIEEEKDETARGVPLGAEERERRKAENLARKAGRGPGSEQAPGGLYSPLTSYITAETELKELIDELQDAVVVGLHTCGDLAPSTLRMFVAKRELASVCSVGCCYHLLSEERWGVWLPHECVPPGAVVVLWTKRPDVRLPVGQGIQMESLFFRAVLHVILRDHFDSFRSEKRVGNVYSKSKSFLDYVRRALGRLELDHAKLSDGVIQDYHDTYTPRMAEMRAFNMLKVILAPCIEGVVLLDRLCYLREQMYLKGVRLP
ncbi:hypothetical protein NHX12_020448, partial [Muraenolepis orangiensis]